MSEEGPLEKLPKLPISNYDVVVYFGIGISALPFIYRYFLQGYDKKFPPIFNGYNDTLVNSVVSLTALAFALYILGHGIAILSSLFIEQFVYRMIGKPSNIIASSATFGISPGTGFRSELRETVIRRLSHPSPSDIARLIFHFPVWVLYLLMYFFRFYGFYETKLSSFIVLRAQESLERNFDFPGTILNNSTRWFKIVEYACANDHPVATAKMYNYMVIYGLFRSTSFLLLTAIWMEAFLYWWIGGLGFLNTAGHGNLLVRVAVLYGAYLISFVGFGKFSRRYTEEALQAFALSRVFN